MANSIRINPPGPEPVGSKQYQQDCVFALEPSLIKLIEMATEAGWDRQQVILALMYFVALRVDDPSSQEPRPSRRPQ